MSNEPLEKIFATSKTDRKSNAEAFRNQLSDAMFEAGLRTEGSLIVNGRLQYAHDARDRKNAKKIWYAAHPNQGRAHFGHFRDLDKQDFYMDNAEPQTPQHARDLFRDVEVARRKDREMEWKVHQKAVSTSLAEWKAGNPASNSHAYVVNKNFKPTNLRQDDMGRLLVPLRDSSGKFSGVQRIAEDGAKRFVAGLKIEGLSFVVGQLPADKSLLCEGIATALTLHEATGLPVVAALASWNLWSVGTDLRLAYPFMQIVDAADNDHLKKVNVGVRKAKRVARALEALIAIPHFDESETGTDFNDYAAIHGLDEVRKAIESAVPACKPLFIPPTPATAATSDKAHAIRLLKWVGDNWAYSNTGWRRWAPIWQEDTIDELTKKAYDLAHVVRDEADALVTRSLAERDPQVRQRMASEGAELHGSLKSLESATVVTRILRVAKELRKIDSSSWNHDAYRFTVNNGVIDLRDVSFRPHRRHDLLSRFSDCFYDKKATCPRWETFVRQVCRSDDDLVDFLQRLLGYILSGLANEQLLVVFQGPGRDGKGTMLELMQDVMGDYARSALADLLVKSRSDRHPTELMDVAGKRLVVCTESEQGAKLFVSRAKQLSGQDRIAARRMHKDSVEFQQTHTLILQTNHLPEITDKGKGIWRRILVVPFHASFNKSEEDNFLREKLRSEASGILNWLLEGFRKYKWYGLKAIPEAVITATDGYRYLDNPAYKFVRGGYRKTSDKDKLIDTSTLYKKYELWAKKRGITPVDQNAFSRGLTDMEVRRHRAAKCRGWLLRAKKGKK